MHAEEIAAVAKTIELIEKNPPKAEGWDHAEQHGPHLAQRVRTWLKEAL